MQHSPQKARLTLAGVAAIVLLAAGLTAQGVQLNDKAEVLYGNASRCSQPATIDFGKVRDATPEWKTIRSDGVKKGSARYDLLMQALTARVRKAVRDAATEAGRDCVVRGGDIKSAKGLQVEDLTDRVISSL